jgi:hypothetical protein
MNCLDQGEDSGVGIWRIKKKKEKGTDFFYTTIKDIRHKN